MKNDKQIAFSELSFQPFSEKFIKIIHYLKPISWNVWICIFTHDQICNPNRD